MQIQLTGGLWLHDPSVAPQGSLVKAKNVVMDREGVVEVRQGATALQTVSNQRILRIFETRGDRYSWAAGSLFFNEIEILTGLAEARPDAFRYNAWNSKVDSVFFTNGTDRKRIDGETAVCEWGSDAPKNDTNCTLGPTNTDHGSFLPGGVYGVAMTFARKEGSTVVYETNPIYFYGPGGTNVTILGATDTIVIGYQAYLNSLYSWRWPFIGDSTAVLPTFSTDQAITHARFYRTADGGASYYWVKDIARGDYESWVFIYGDETLGGLIETDHNRPPTGKYAVGPAYNGYCFILDGNNIHWCKAKQPEYWPIAYFAEISEPQDLPMGLTIYRGTVYAITQQKIVQIQGTGFNTFFPIPGDVVAGATGPDAWTHWASAGILHLGNDGIYLFNGGSDQKWNNVLDPIFEQKSPEGMPNVNLQRLNRCWLRVFDNVLYFGYPGVGKNYPDNIARVYLATGKVSYFNYGVEITTVSIDRTNDLLYAGTVDGRIIQLEAGADDLGTTIAIEVKSPEIATPLINFSPSMARYDTYAGGSETLNAVLRYDSKQVQTHTLSGKDRDSRLRLIGAEQCRRLSVEVTGNGSNIKIYRIDVT